MEFNFTALTEHFVIVVLVACLIVGYLCKHTFTNIPNKYIPLILAVVGAVLNAIVGSPSVETIVYGALMGLSSTGLHQLFKKFVEGTKTEESVAE